MTPLTADQKKYLVPAAIGTVVFVLCDEIICRGKKGKTYHAGVNRQINSAQRSKATRQSLISGAVGTVAGYFLYDKAKPETKADLDKYALPAGAAAASYVAVNRLVMPKVKPGTDPRPYALGAAAVGAFLANKQLSPSTPTVGMLPIFEPPFEPPFPPAFGPEFNG